MADLKQILLGGDKAKECSGRGVRLRALALDDCAKVRETVAAELGPEATMLQFNLANSRSCVSAMVAEVTENAGFKASKDLVGATWKKVTRQELEEGGLAKYFTTPDLDALIKVFQKTHSVTEKEVDDILGEAQVVTVD
jgi:hypothetical protein